jgi:signal transduction histidine kinase
MGVRFLLLPQPPYPISPPFMDQLLKTPIKKSRTETRQRSLYQQIKWARFWLPLAIVGVVLFHQLVVVPLGGETWQFWEEILFYSILGPIVTFLTLNWIASEVKQREEAQNELRSLYNELQESHALLGAIQKVTEQFASAPDLETALSAASQGITQVTGAKGAGIFLGSGALRVSQQYGLDKALFQDARSRDHTLLQKGKLESSVTLDGQRYWILTSSLALAAKPEGSIHAYYASPPQSDQRETFSILASEFSAAAEATRTRTRDLLTLVEVDRSIRAEGNLERLLQTLLTQMMARADATIGGVYLADEEHLLQLSVSQGTTTMNNSLRVGDGFVGEVAALTNPQIDNYLTNDERGTSIILDHARSAVALPMLNEQELLGVVVLAHEEANHFDEASLPFLNLVAGQVSLAVRNARAYLQSEELAIAEERARIAREIHDGIAQALAFSALKLDLVSRLMTTEPSKAEQELKTTKVTLREMIKEVRRSIFALRPIDLERHGFVETIRRYCSDYGEQNNMNITLAIEELPQLTTISEAVLFRIFQEAMNNVAKHAGASKVCVTLGPTEKGHAFISVEDNGKGFDLFNVSDRVTSAGGLGLKQMKERLEARGGRFDITTAVSQGTKVFASVPE